MLNNNFTNIIRKSVFGIVLAGLLIASPLSAQEERFTIQKKGSDKAMLNPAPWSGYWWDRKSGGIIDSFKVYDAAVEKKTGKNPGATAWESDQRNGHYDPAGPNWAGHCNGWAAAAILEPEPKTSKTYQGFTFSTANQKALLSEMYMDCYAEFYGKRKNNNFPLSSDIRPDLFHRLLVDNIKMKKRGIVADTSFNSPVWNYPIYGYEMTWKNTPLIPFQIEVSTKVFFADDGVDIHFLGTKTFTKDYHYYLYTNLKGEVIRGEWDVRSQFDHPDFVWVPTGDSPARGTGENPCIHPQFVHEITGRSGGSDTDENIDAIVTESGLNPNELFN
ncbi:MAG: hypothetical protein HQM10_18675 [Candidatus Riflebacteria bacterium]|nr:hypothetical protein [Candidatus Riflebacteria bacterium]